jgi:hypothetical protein
MKLSIHCDRCHNVHQSHFSDPKNISGHIPTKWIYVVTTRQIGYSHDGTTKKRLYCANCAEEYETFNQEFMDKKR